MRRASFSVIVLLHLGNGGVEVVHVVFGFEGRGEWCAVGKSLWVLSPR